MTKGTTRSKGPAKTGVQAKAKGSKTAKKTTPTKASRAGSATKRPSGAARAASKSSAARKAPKVAAKAESLAVENFSVVMTERANRHGQAPTKLIKDGDGWLICYLQSDGSYANCQPYTGPV